MEKKINKASNKILLDKFKAEWNQEVGDLYGQQDNEISKETFIEIMKKLKFIKEYTF